MCGPALVQERWHLLSCTSCQKSNPRGGERTLRQEANCPCPSAGVKGKQRRVRKGSKEENQQLSAKLQPLLPPQDRNKQSSLGGKEENIEHFPRPDP